MDIKRDLFNIVQIFNVSIVDKKFEGKYTERSFVNDNLGYKEKIIIDLPNEIFDSVKNHLLQTLKVNDVKHSCMVWKKNSLELYVEFHNKKSRIFGHGNWKIIQVFVKEEEICFIVDRVISKVKDQFPKHQQNPKPIGWEDIYVAGKECFKMATLILIVFANILSLVLDFVYKICVLLPAVIDSLMPLFITIVNGITKCVGGLYLLILALRNGPPANRIPTRDPFTNSVAESRQGYKAVQYKPIEEFSHH